MTAANATFNAPRGMRDFYPDEMLGRNRLFDAWRVAASQFGFKPYDAPVVETLELLKRKSGEEIVDQIYAFRDKSGRELALRPEMTPTLARMVAARQGSLVFPIKWYTIAQCFRYERMTRGRKREHYQWNLDVVGEASVAAEVEVIATAVHGLNLMGLTQDDFRVHFSSRMLLAELLATLGIAPEHHAATFLALDKRGKIDDDAIRLSLKEAGLTGDQANAVFRLLEIDGIPAAQAILPADSPAVRMLNAFETQLAAYGLTPAMRFDIGVIRGLAYYTGIVFEAFDAARQFRAIFGGGRYDNLLGDVGGQPQTGVGLGFGDVVVMELIDRLQRQPADTGQSDIAVGYMSDDQRLPAMALARHLREEGRQVDLALAPEKPKAFFGRVSRDAFREAAYLGPDDVAAGRVRIKTLATRQEHERVLAA